jgi:uncharacterized YigZ family protein
MASYPVPARQVTAEIREKGSRFLAVTGGVAGEDEAGAVLAGLARGHPDATHLCWAMRVGWPPRERSSDAGEPAGTAGVPMLQVLRGAGLSDVLAVVARWFGGVKLGKGGLARAYAAAVRAALEQMPTALRTPRVRLALSAPVTRIGAVKRLVRPPEVEIESETYGKRGQVNDGQGLAIPEGQLAELVLRVDEDRRASLEQALADLRVTVRVVPGPGR